MNKLTVGFFIVLGIAVLALTPVLALYIQSDSKPLPPGGLKENQTILKYETLVTPDVVQREWEIQETIPAPQNLSNLTANEPLVANIAFSMQPNLLAQVTTWRDECAAALADPEYVNNPANNVPDPSWGNITEVQFCQGSVDALTVLIDANGGTLNTANLTNNNQCPNCVVVLQAIRDSYLRADDLAYLVNGLNISRNNIRLTLDNWLVAIGAEALVSRPEDEVRFVRYFVADKQCVGNCTQYWSPNGTMTEVQFSEGAGDGDGDNFDELDEGIIEGTPDDATTTRQSANNPNDGIEGCPGDLARTPTTLEDLTTPGSTTGHVIRHRAIKSASGGRDIDLKMFLCEAETGTDTQIANQTDAAITDTAWNTYTYNLTAGEAGTIVDYVDLYFVSTCNAVGGGPARYCLVTAQEYETPDGAAAGARRIIRID